MATTGEVFAGAGAALTRTGATGNQWTDPGNILADDEVTANWDGPNNKNSHWLRASSFGFAIPAGSTIDRIVARTKRLRVGAAINTFSVRLTKDGTTPIGADKTTGVAWGTNYSVEAFGASPDADPLWSTTWTPAEINASTFGLLFAVVTAGGGEFPGKVDYITMEIIYTEGAPPVSEPHRISWW